LNLSSSLADRPEYHRTVSNITGRKRIEELHVIKERLEYLLKWSPVIAYTCEPYDDYVVTFISENVLSRLGYAPREFFEDPKFWPNHIHPEEVTRVLTGLCQLFENDHYTHEYRFLHKNGTYRWVHDEMKLARDDAGRPSEIIGYLIDITEQKQMEEDLLVLGHELRDPLTGISGAAYYLKKKLAPSLDRESIDMLDLIERAIESASKIMNRLLE
jgi:PAS domain S-box-containing protein